MNKLPGLILGFAAGVGAGAVLGALAGILFAPREGTETRRILREKAAEARQKAMDSMHKGKTMATQKADQAADATREALDKVEEKARANTAGKSNETLPR